MPNYKPWPRDTVGQYYSHPLKQGETPVTLWNATNGSTAADSLHEVGSGIYTVTSGKTLRVTAVIINWITTNSEYITFYQGDTENAETTYKFQYGSSQVKEVIQSSANWEVASGKFVVFNPLALGVAYVMVIGYEY